MENHKSPFFKTIQGQQAAITTEEEPTGLLFDRDKVIGTPVKVMRTGKPDPDEGWHIAEVLYHAFRKGEDKINQPAVKVRKPDTERPDRGLEKIVPLQSLEKINPEIKFLVFEKNVDYLLYEDEKSKLKTGQIIDINFEEKYLVVCLSRQDDDGPSQTEKVNMKDLINKSKDLETFKKVLEDFV